MTPLEACYALAKVTPASAKVGPKGDRVSLSTLLSAATQANAEERLREGVKWFREKRQNRAKPAALLWAFEALGEQPWPDPPAARGRRIQGHDPETHRSRAASEGAGL